MDRSAERSTSASANVSPRWDVSTESGFLACYDATFAEAYRCAARLVGGDRQRAEDLVHDAFVSLLHSAREGSSRDVGIGWVLTRVRHRFIDQLRSADREDRRLRLVAGTGAAGEARGAVDDGRSGAASTDGDPGGGALGERDGGGGGILDGLPDRERAALVLRYVDALPVAEVAELMGTTVRATESLLQRAKRRARTNRASEGA